MIGIASDQVNNEHMWIGFSFNPEIVALVNIDVPEEINALLQAGEYEQAYNSGFNILTFATKDQVELNTLLQEAYNKHLNKYYPGLLESE